MDAVLDALRSEEPELPCVDTEVRRFIALAREVHRAAERERVLYQEVRAFRVAARGVIGNAA
ncbi:hypothetical protein [Streptomyces sp. NPDC101455]|uniref:hypothetical protein n=1 Tax=Streptomyces sp. NPDC101455 TaxID=3366142 RepID=UPI0037FC13DF